jgi:hypothetical protein
MFAKYVLIVATLCLCLTGFSTTSAAKQAETVTYEGSANVLQRDMETFWKIEPQLTAEQKEKFTTAFNRICEVYRTAGLLISSVTDAADEASAHTALMSFQRVMGELPGMIDKLDRLVRSFKVK